MSHSVADQRQFVRGDGKVFVVPLSGPELQFLSNIQVRT
jgi:hypothetical protein